MPEQLYFHFLLSCIGEGNGNPVRCSCLENPRDSGAWWAAVYGVAQGWTRLKRLSSSSSSSSFVASSLEILVTTWAHLLASEGGGGCLLGLTSYPVGSDISLDS